MANQFTTLQMGQKFKRTPAGDIPVDWEATTFQDSFDFLRTANNSRSDLNDTDEVGYLHYGDIHTKWRIRLRCDQADLPRISESKVDGIPSLRNGDLVMADASEDYEGLGVSVEVCNLGEQRIVAGLHTFLLRDKGGNFADGFRGYIQFIPAVRQRLIQIATGGSVYGLSKRNLSDIPIPRPPLEEQKKIADILSAVDATIAKIAAVVRKTKELRNGLVRLIFDSKQGHGKSRTNQPIVSLRLLCELITKGTTPTTYGFKYTDSGVRFIKIENIGENGRILPSGITYISGETHQALRRSILKKNDILFSIAGALGRSCVVTEDILPANTNQAVAIIRLEKEKADPAYIRYFLDSDAIRSRIENIGTQGAQINLSLAQVGDMPIPLPPLAEQRRIAGVIATLDNQIFSEMLFSRNLERTKLALMRVLLTGKVRVP